jgi:hypothetical protein
MPPRYFGGEIDVQLGDRVAVSVWCSKRLGRVVYVPGISRFNPEFEYNGLKWVGVRLQNKALLATIVRHRAGNLKKNVRFIGRDDSPCEMITESSREFAEHGEGLAL